tara:strand:- start:977 stop:2743 length:1767 start_codon:yes stop_codon:yes gene_type:complete
MEKKEFKIDEILNTAVTNHRKNNFSVAKKLYDQILKIDPNHVEANFLLGSLYAQTNNYEEAKSFLYKTIKIQKNHAEAYYNLGNVFKEQMEQTKAIESYRKAIEIKPDFVASYSNLGLVYQELGNLEDAINSFRKAIQIKPDLVAAYNNLGLALQALGNYKESIESFNKAIELLPTHVDLHNNLGLTLQKLGKHEEAIKCFKEAIKIKENFGPAHYNMGNTLKEIGRNDEAADSFKKVIKHTPENLFVAYSLSNLDENFLDENIKNKIDLVLLDKNSSKKNVAYGNFLLSRYEFKKKDYEKEFNFLLKGHKYYYESESIDFEKQIDLIFNTLPNIKELINFDNLASKDNKINPIFIIGTPRCGSTLIEKVISSGKMNIPAGEETEIIHSFVKTRIKKKQVIDGDGFLKYIIDQYKERDLIEQKYNNTFTDKSLENFFYLDLIKKFLPNSKVINCKRNPLSSIMSILKNNLTNIGWTHDVNYIFKYFDIYYKLIENFKKKFPNFLYELNYENFVMNPEHESKKLFEFCNLAWDKRSLEFYKRKDLVSKTASNIQIRQAIYKDSIKRYLPYKQFLNKYSSKYNWFEESLK